MTILVETSALVAILLEEQGWQALAMRIEEDAQPLTSAICVFEAACALAQHRDHTPREAYGIVNRLTEVIGISVIGFSVEMTEHAIAAREAFGKGRHPAGLNFGDCLSYGAARHLQVPLLFVGDDFARTDVVRA